MSLVTLVGYATITYIIYIISKYIYNHFIAQADQKKYGAGKGSWALITGAREGIGKGFAYAQASNGFNVVLTARNLKGLENLAKELESKYNIRTICLENDASKLESVKEIVDTVSNLELGVLINNVGVNTEFPCELSTTDEKELQAILNINVVFTTHLTRAQIPKLSERPSLIMFLSSYTSAHPLPMMSIYSASKAYNEAFGKALAGELRPKNIDVRSILPYFVVSPMSGFRNPSWNVPDPISFAHTALAQVQSNDYTYSPHWGHDMVMRACTLLPDSMMGSMGLKNMSLARTRLIRRKERILAGKTRKNSDTSVNNSSSITTNTTVSTVSQ